MDRDWPVSGKTGNGHTPGTSLLSDESAFGYPRDFLHNRYVYLLISPRARGLSIGINVNPVVRCTFECLYCEIDRSQAPRIPKFDIDIMITELRETLRLAVNHSLRRFPRYASLPDHLLQLRHVALSGDGEPTLSEHFIEAIQSIIHLRALGEFPFFKLVLLTNSSALDQPNVQRGIGYLTREDEVWAKLDGGTQRYFRKINGSSMSLDRITENILLLASKRPVIIQSLFPAVNGVEPSTFEIDRYAKRLKWLKENGADIPLVQIYSATRPMARLGCTHLPLSSLMRIAHRVRSVAQLPAEVF